MCGRTGTHTHDCSWPWAALCDLYAMVQVVVVDHEHDSSLFSVEERVAEAMTEAAVHDLAARIKVRDVEGTALKGRHVDAVGEPCA